MMTTVFGLFMLTGLPFYDVMRLMVQVHTYWNSYTGYYITRVRGVMPRHQTVSLHRQVLPFLSIYPIKNLPKRQLQQNSGLISTLPNSCANSSECVQ